MVKNKKHPASFRDPSGFIFRRDGNIYRQINQGYQKNYQHLIESGLYEKLVADRLLIPHQEIDVAPFDPESAYRVIRPTQLSFISYPYEWSFSQLKDAALTVLSIQKQALAHGMSLKDSSAYNIQYLNGKPILIDTLSFEAYSEGKPWVAYRQFCQHFLAPLALICYCDIRLNQLLQINVDGIPLDLATALLPLRARINLNLYVHLYLHAAAQKKFAGQSLESSNDRNTVKKTGILGIIDSLEIVIRKLSWNPGESSWANYAISHNYSDTSFEHKKHLVTKYLEIAQPNTVWDLGANTGIFSRLSSKLGIQTLAFDNDPGAVEKNYRQCVSENERHLLPLFLDLANPSPGIGWHNHERSSIMDRASADMLFALALLHHIAITNNVPFEQIAQFFADLGHWLVIEFIPKSDPQVQQLLATRDDIFVDYSQNGFERAFGECFSICESEQLADSQRILYLLERKPPARTI
jgi:hypothetical protein